jgi:hypothetical protein
MGNRAEKIGNYINHLGLTATPPWQVGSDKALCPTKLRSTLPAPLMFHHNQNSSTVKREYPKEGRRGMDIFKAVANYNLQITLILSRNSDS